MRYNLLGNTCFKIHSYLCFRYNHGGAVKGQFRDCHTSHTCSYTTCEVIVNGAFLVYNYDIRLSYVIIITGELTEKRGHVVCNMTDEKSWSSK
jgi:hypothetical protein